MTKSSKLVAVRPGKIRLVRRRKDAQLNSVLKPNAAARVKSGTQALTDHLAWSAMTDSAMELTLYGAVNMIGLTGD